MERMTALVPTSQPSFASPASPSHIAVGGVPQGAFTLPSPQSSLSLPSLVLSLALGPAFVQHFDDGHDFFTLSFNSFWGFVLNLSLS